MMDYEYANDLLDKSFSFIINFINKDIKELKTYKDNLHRFSYNQAISGKLIYIKYKSLQDEIERLTLEIHFLENKRLHYIKIKEQV